MTETTEDGIFPGLVDFDGITGGPLHVDNIAPALPPYVNPFVEQVHTWYGTDGSVWPLTDPDTGVFLVQEGIEGLHLPVADEVTRDSPALAGSSYHGYRIKARDVTWVLYVYSDDSTDAFYDLEARIFKSMRIGSYGTWRVALPDGSFRELRMRQVPMAFTHERDPGKFGWVKYPIRFIADEQPLWTYPYEVPGSQITFETMEGPDFFGDGAGGPPLYLTAQRQETVQEITNVGDEDVWPTIVLTGPLDTVTMKIGKRSYTVTANLQIGEALTIDTHPRTFGVTDHTGANRIKSLSSWVFEPLPWGKTTRVEVVTQGLGGGTVIFHVDPLFHRAWG